MERRRMERWKFLSQYLVLRPYVSYGFRILEGLGRMQGRTSNLLSVLVNRLNNKCLYTCLSISFKLSFPYTAIPRWQYQDCIPAV